MSELGVDVAREKADRTCGQCTACCTVLGIRELQKPAFQCCPNLAGAGGGCGIYGARPNSCRFYRCEWLDADRDRTGLGRKSPAKLAGLGARRDRPDRLGVILDSFAPAQEVLDRAQAGDEAARQLVGAALVTVRAREVRPGAFKQPKVKRGLEHLARTGWTVALVPFGGRRLPVARPL